MDDEPLPCPFCGSTEIGHRTNGRSYLAFVCMECGCSIDAVDGNPEQPEAWIAATTKWNTRAPACHPITKEEMGDG